MKTGLYFGSFNPIHIGHLAIANFMVEFTDLDEVWFVVSPHNPLKKRATLLEDHHRLRLVELATDDDDRFSVSDIETKMPQPSYTIDTLTWLKEKYPGREFGLIMGGDNLATLNKWKNAAEIVRNFTLYVYPRKEKDISVSKAVEELIKMASIVIAEAPLMEISGTFIRDSIASRKDIRHFLPAKVWTYIDEMNFYRK
ncbi:MAG: nicotinate (nicotinamide) nucleotide adenylyltransferase [Marinilabiliaceae bacterium]|jgi:nicotinate-nucleotide adenylyltransferase|nr:nicotinate (nicotinamide) nucleotide adenylyltransferase [Marinilabiliaceae bacterium]